MKIVSARITAMPTRLGDPLPRVYATFEDGVEQALFSYYPDELSFRADEFVGLTHAQACALRHQKDVAYLRAYPSGTAAPRQDPGAASFFAVTRSSNTSPARTPR